MASIWKQQYLDKVETHLGTYDFPIFQDFIDLLKKDFKDVDTKATTLYRLNTAHQGVNTIERHNTWFNLMINQSGLDADDNYEVLLNYYQSFLNSDIMEAIWKVRPQPNTLKGWMEAAQNKENHQRQLQHFYQTTQTETIQGTQKETIFHQQKKGIQNEID